MGKEYSEDSIQKLDPLEFTRLRPDTYCGSTADSTQLVREIVSNSVDEHLAGNCYNINISYDAENNIIEVEDDGQGIIPMKPMPGSANKTILECAYGEINVSGKYDKEDGAVYENSTGAFGIGSKLTTFLSHWLEVTTYTLTGWEWVRFEEGRFVRRDGGMSRGNGQAIPNTGIKVRFQPSEEFFDDPHPNIDRLREYLFMTVCVCPDLTIEFNGEEFSAKDGLHALNRKLARGANVLTSRFYSSGENSRQKLNLALWMTDKDTTEIVAFCNYSTIEAGTPITQVKTSITKVFNKWGQGIGIIKKGDNLPGNLIQEGMIISFNLVSPNIRYDSQTKVRVTSTVDNVFIANVLESDLLTWLDTHIAEGKRIIERALLSKKASDAAKKARNNVLAGGVKPGKTKLVVMPSKLADCTSKRRSECELYVCEGDSAAGGMKIIRDSKTQAVLGIRGKILNALSSTDDQISKNAEIADIVKALGINMVYTGKKLSVLYDESKLRYGKLVIAADRDPDGNHIQNLLLGMVWKLFPQLLLDGHVYVAEPPLYKAEWGKDSYQYIADGNELSAFKKTHRTKFTLAYCKGLGEMSPQQLGDTIMNPATRKISKVCVSDVDQSGKVITALMGKDVRSKKEFVFGGGKIG